MTVFALAIVGAVVATPFYGWTPVLVVCGGMMAAAVVLKALR